MAEDPFISSTQHQPHIYRPIPRRNWSQASQNSQISYNSTSDSTAPSNPPSDNLHFEAPLSSTPSSPDRSSSDNFLAQLNARLLQRSRNTSNGYLHDENGTTENGDMPPRKNKSFLNMTSSTLFGIYDDVTAGSTPAIPSETETPWGTGAETPTGSSGLIQAWERGMGDWDTNAQTNGHTNGNGLGTGSPDAGLSMKARARSGSSHVQGGVSRVKVVRMGHTNKQNAVVRGFIIASKILALFLFGVTYGVIVSHLHNTKELFPMRGVGDVVDYAKWSFFASWGVAGVVLGSLLPYADLLWESEGRKKRVDEGKGRREVESEESEGFGGEQWNEVVRSVGAFVGIAFAIRKLPWQSTLQLTLTLALVNPALWYILDRSKTGFTVSILYTSLLTSFILLANPDVLPSPSLPVIMNSTRLSSVNSGGSDGNSGTGGGLGREGQLFAGVVSYESLAVATWVGSVLFCSCVCFGSIGRRLAVLGEWR
ncbi:hypothetical protein GQ43DRAFT_466777 [Delitschia confertaspora ATCC 74209]|uniref:Insulin-induced protein n=1 Tax=Delitschia confertaspora ATCC 74209 TaxID=1513339 RepID=A0A9P4MNC8_9PLEO|nr:hypothetical protein GQ43DRAFT_466777 [Delitschia confertaspora ATCC 74209]